MLIEENDETSLRRILSDIERRGRASLISEEEKRIVNERLKNAAASGFDVDVQ